MPYDFKALVVDDDEHVRTFLVVLMRKVVSGPVHEARNGHEAIEVYEREKPDLMLLDVNMPGMDGLEALTQLRRKYPEAVIVMITSLATRRIVERALGLGASYFIRKDTPKPQMIELIKETIEIYLINKSPAASGA